MAVLIRDPKEREAVASYIVTRWDEMQQERSERVRMWERCLLAYLCHFDKKWVDYAEAARRSHRFISISWDAIQTLEPQIVDAVLGATNWLQIAPEVVGGDLLEDDIFAEKVRYFIYYQMRMGKFKPTLRLAVRSMLITGNCPWTLSWKVRKSPNMNAARAALEKWYRDNQEYDMAVRDLMEKHKQVTAQSAAFGGPPPPMPQLKEPPPMPRDMSTVFAGPVLNIGSIFNYCQEQHPDDPMNAFRIMRTWRTKDFLQQKAKPDEEGYRFYENLKNVRESESEATSRDNVSEVLMKSALYMQMPQNKTKVELKTGLGNIPGLDRMYRGWKITVANDGEVIYAEPSPMFSGRPQINNARLIKMEGDPYGTGVLEKALDEQDSTNALHNQNIDATASVIQPEYEVVEDNLVDGIMKPSGPGARHAVYESGAITPITKNFQGLPIGIEVVRESIARFERFTGAINTATGNDESATRTARNTSVIATKLGAHVIAVEEELVTEAVNIMIEMNGTFIQDEQVFAITQDNKNIVVNVSPLALQRGWIAHSMSSQYLAEREERINNLMMGLQLNEQRVATGMPSPVKEVKLWQRVFKEILGDWGDLVDTEEEFAQKMEQYYRAIAAQNQGVSNERKEHGGQTEADVGQTAGSPGANLQLLGQGG